LFFKKIILTFLELSYLYELENDFDGAVRVMISNPTAFQDLKYKELIGKVKLLDLIYDSIRFYLQYFPQKTTELLISISTRLEPARVVQTVSKLGQIPAIKKYLELVQEKDIREVNNALHELYIEEEDFDSLRGTKQHILVLIQIYTFSFFIILFSFINLITIIGIFIS
jgi:clathrin heavy chain